MRKERESVSVLTIFMAIAVALLLPCLSFAGSLEPPSGPPVSTMKTLDQIPPTWSQTLQCDTTACPRFELVFPNICGLRCITWDGVLDKETGLVWQKTLDTTKRTWYQAQGYCNVLILGGRLGWRMPSLQELSSLVDPSQQTRPALPSGHPFTNVQTDNWLYWSATTTSNSLWNGVWGVYMNSGYVYSDAPADDTAFIWCVRGGQGVDVQ